MPRILQEPETGHIAQVLDLMGMPAFLVDVEGPGQFRFAHVSTEHVRQSGIAADALIGKTPHEALPVRIADTVAANYEKCRCSAVVETYEETLELPSGPRLWLTSLSPIHSGDLGRGVVQILGVAADITAAKTKELDHASSVSKQTAATEKMRAFAAHTMLDAQGPMRGVLAWLDILRDGFLDLGDGKLDEIDQMSLMVGEAIIDMDNFLHSFGVSGQPDAPCVPIDLGHICRDMAALVDPSGRVDMLLPTDVIEGDWAVIQILLRRLLEQSVRRAVRKVTLQVSSQGPEKLEFVITDDSAIESSTADWMRELSSTAAMVKERGGSISTTSSLESGAQTIVVLPGRVLAPSIAQTQNQSEKKRA